MKRLSRRAFFDLLSPRVDPDQASGFSLEAFYAARGPQQLPPIAIRPSVLHYATELTHVGCPPPHAPPPVEDDPTYAALAATHGLAPQDDDERKA